MKAIGEFYAPSTYWRWTSSPSAENGDEDSVRLVTLQCLWNGYHSLHLSPLLKKRNQKGDAIIKITTIAVVKMLCVTNAKNSTKMKRRDFIFLSSFATIPLIAFEKMKSIIGMRTDKPFKVNSGDARFGTHYKMKGVTINTLDIKISGKDTNNELVVFEQTGQTPNGGPPLHIHVDQDEWFFVTEGEYLFQCADQRFHLSSGDTIFLPRNIPHAFIQLTEKAKTIVSYMPAGRMEDFFAETDRWTSPPSKEEIAKVFADHGMKVVGEPLKIN